MAKAHKPSSRSSGRGKSAVHGKTNSLKIKPLTPQHPPQRGGVEMVDPRVQAQLKVYDEALSLFHQQKFAKATIGPAKAHRRRTISTTLWRRWIASPAKRTRR